MPEAVRRVASIDEEDQILGTCACGRAWILAFEEVAPLHSRWYDALVMRCAGCRAVTRALFDITAFFEPVGAAWTRAA